MKWLASPLSKIAPAKPARVEFPDEQELWHLTLDQIESHTGRIIDRRIAPAANAGTSTFAFDEGNVLYSKLRPYLNKVVWPGEKGIATSELVPLRPESSVLLPEFLTYYLRSPGFVRFASARVAGVKMPRVIMAKFWEHQVPLPAPSEQRRIVEILDQADALRKLRAEADAKAERILPALFIQMFGDPATNPMGWPSVPFRSLLSQKPRNGISPSSGGKVHGQVLTLTAITGAHFDEQAVKDALFAKPLRSEKFVDEQDFLICRGNGNINLVGRGRFPIRSMPETVFPDTIIAARIDPEKLDRHYLETQWELPSFRTRIEARARTTSGIHKVNQRVIGNIEVLAPPVERQRLFSSNANAFGTLRRDRSATILGNLFSVLLHRAFDGSLTSSWREAHMKELLQEMEQQAKALGGANS